MRLKSCFSRYIRYVLRCVACSALTFFVNSNMLINKSGIWLVSFAIFVLVSAIDSFIFSMYFGKIKHIKYGIIYPYVLFIITTYIGHFAISSARWRYLFLPFEFFGNFGLSRLESISVIHLIVIALMFICAKLGQKKFYKCN